MQNLTSTLGRLAVVLTGALALGSCSRANYAFLPKADSYLGTTTAAPKAQHAAPAVALATPAQAVEASPVAAAEAPAVAPEITVATAPVAATKPAVAAAPQAVPAAEAEAIATAPTTTTATAAAPKLNLVQRLALAKVTKKLNKLAANSPQIKQGDNTAHTARINGNLRTGLILLLIGLIVGIFSNIIGLIIALVGVIFIVLWLLDEL